MQGIYPAWDCPGYGEYPEQSIEEIVFGPTLSEEEVIAMLKDQGKSADLADSAAYTNMRPLPVRAVYNAMWSEYRDIANTGATPLFVEMPYQYRDDAEDIFQAVQATCAMRNTGDPLARNAGPNRTWRTALIRKRAEILEMRREIKRLRDQADRLSWAAQHAYLSLPADGGHDSIDYANSVLAEALGHLS